MISSAGDVAKRGQMTGTGCRLNCSIIELGADERSVTGLYQAEHRVLLSEHVVRIRSAMANDRAIWLT